MKITFVTKNTGKFLTAKIHLEEFNIDVTQKRMDVVEIRSGNIRDVAMKKGLYAVDYTEMPFFVHDSGFFIESLNGFPGTYVNFVIGTIGVEGILKLVGKDRTCRFEDALVYFYNEEPVVFTNSISGKLSTKIMPISTEKYAWSSLWLIFIPEGHEKVLAEFSKDEYEEFIKNEKNSCFKQLGRWLVKK